MPIAPITLNVCEQRLLHSDLNGQRQPTTWLVTGAAGFIGSNLVEALLRLGQRVIGLDVLPLHRAHNLRDVEHYVMDKQMRRFTYYQLGIQGVTSEWLEQLEVDVILHCAALSNVTESMLNSDVYTTNNIAGTHSLFKAAWQAKVTRIVYASSIAVYGQQLQITPVAEHDAYNATQLSHYAITKRANELHARLFSATSSMNCIGLRYSNVFGPRQCGTGPNAPVIARWVQRTRANEECVIYGGGTQTRDFTFIDNVVQANILAACTPQRSARGAVFNVASGTSISLNDAYRHIATRIDKTHSGTATIGAARANDIAHVRLSIGNIGRTLGYAPTHSFTDGLQVLLRWCTAQDAPGASAAVSV